jgi:hypothetical protein
MATLKQVYDLVHSLDKNEKKNISILIDALGGKARQRYANSLRIFNEQKEFDADRLKKKLSADVSGMSLTEANDYFFNFVCKALQSNAAGSGNLGLVKDLLMVETFVSKGLFELAEKHLTPLLAKLETGNSFGLLSRGLELHSIVIASNPLTSRDFEKRLGTLNKRKKVAADQMQYVELMQLIQQINLLVSKIGDPRTKQQQAEYAKVYTHPIFSLKYDDISRQSFPLFAPTKIDMINVLEGPDAAIREGLVALTEFRKRFDTRHHYVAEFYLLDSLLSDCFRASNAAAMPPLINDLKKLVSLVQQKAVLQKVFAKIMQSELVYYALCGKYEEGVTCFKNWMKPDKQSLWVGSPLDYMNYFMGARLHYMNNTPGQALDCLNILQGREKDFKPTSLLGYRFLYLLCYYQTEQASLVFSTANSIYKSLLKQDKLHAPERAVLRFAKSSGSIEKMKKNIRSLHATLSSLQKDPLNAPFFLFADYVEWLEKEMKVKR